MTNFNDANITKYVSDLFKEDNVTALGFFYSILALLSGLLTTYISKWMDKRKTKHEEENEDITLLSQTSSKLIEDAKTVSDMARIMLKDQDEFFQKRIEMAVADAKEECSKQIQDLKVEYQKMISDMEKEIKTLRDEKEILSKKVSELQTRLKKYEKSGTGPLSDESIKS